MAEAIDTAQLTAGWRGRLALEFRRRHDRTILARRRHYGPLLVQRTFHPEGAPCHAYVIHPPGGVVGGDSLELDIRLDRASHALITTPAAAKFYRTAGPSAYQLQRFAVSEAASLEFLPAETILHGASRTLLDNRFDLHADARLITFDVLCLGRPGSGDHFLSGVCTQQTQIRRGDAMLLHDRLNLEAGDRLLTAPWGLDGRTVIGTCIATPAPEGLENRLREALASRDGLRLGISRLGDVLICRCLGHGAEPVREALHLAWSLIREAVIGVPPHPPRIWKT
ncbi:MAG: urease accessory protein UreD [Ectothiorhodospiraceae bacterium]|nr:urease accessory protein UreD [Ectothiorhodospiraceae bacterium]MCH8502970.1 urease accessory protein UreD [Ectothiorhodospiraceae bacterium]